MSAFEISGGGISSGLFDAYAILRDEKTQNTQGGSATSGAWRTRDLNVEVDPDGIVSLSSNQFTLAAGSYFLRAVCPAGHVQRHQSRLQNITDGTTVEEGSSMYSGTNTDLVETLSQVEARFTITATKTFEIQHQVGTTRTTDGFGVAANFGTEVYTVVEIWREGSGGGISGAFDGLAYKSGYWYRNVVLGANTNVGLTQDRMTLTAFEVRSAHTFDRIDAFLATNAGAGAVARMGIYADDGEGFPGALVLDAGTVAADSGAPSHKTITISEALDKGIYWLALVQQVAAGGTFIGSSSTSLRHWQIGQATASINEHGYYQSGVSGALPAISISGELTGAPLMFLRAA